MIRRSVAAALLAFLIVVSAHAQEQGSVVQATSVITYHAPPGWTRTCKTSEFLSQTAQLLSQNRTVVEPSVSLCVFGKYIQGHAHI